MVLGKIGQILKKKRKERKKEKRKKKKKLSHLLTLHIRINSKWIKVLNIRLETKKILEENIGSKISDVSCSNTFSDLSSQAREIKEK